MDVTKDVLYSSDQIHIPPKFLFVLKAFAKAAIKTQPYDLLLWSCHYFQALADEREPPVKLRLEHPIYNTDGGLSRGYLKILLKQLSGEENVDTKILKTRWLGSCLKLSELQCILCLCGALMSTQVSIFKFAAVSAGMLTKNLKETMTLLCEMLTVEPEGGSAMISLDDFLQMYTFLAQLDASADVEYIDGLKKGNNESFESENTEVVKDTVNEPVNGGVCDCDSEESIHAQLSSVDPEVQVSRLPVLGVSVAISGGSTSKRLTYAHSHVLERPPSLDQLIRKSTLTYELERQVRKSSDPREILIKMEQTKKEEKAALAAEAVAAAEESEVTSQEGEELEEEKLKMTEIEVFNEDGQEIPPNIDKSSHVLGSSSLVLEKVTVMEEQESTEEGNEEIASEHQMQTLESVQECKENRIKSIESAFEEIARLNHLVMMQTFDLGALTGRQMSLTSAEFIVPFIESEIIDNAYNQTHDSIEKPKEKMVDPKVMEEIGIIFNEYLAGALKTIIPEPKKMVEEKEHVITMVYAVPGIGPAVPEPIIAEFVQYAQDMGGDQGVFMPRYLRHMLCPPLEQFLVVTNCNCQD